MQQVHKDVVLLPWKETGLNPSISSAIDFPQDDSILCGFYDKSHQDKEMVQRPIKLKSTIPPGDFTSLMQEWIRRKHDTQTESHFIIDKENWTTPWHCGLRN